MSCTNSKESGLESLIVSYLTDRNGYEEGTNADYNEAFAVDETRLFRFLRKTQAAEMEKLGGLADERGRRAFLGRLSSEIAKRGIVDVLRRGIKDRTAHFTLYYVTPTEGNAAAKALYDEDIFSVTRQLRYTAGARLALDLCIFVNGLPLITMELKNSLTKQSTADAVRQYREDRSPRDLLFSFKRCMVHFAVDDRTVMFSAQLTGKASVFLPFNKGYQGGAGNPPNPAGLMTDYLWQDILTRAKLSRIIEGYAQLVKETGEGKGEKMIFPRYHQFDCVERLLADVRTHGIGRRYLVQHSAGSGKSNSIAWLAHGLVGLMRDGRPMVDSVLVVTDRRILDRQIRETVKQFMQVRSTFTWAKRSSTLRKAIADGKRIIVTTIEKFPYIAQAMNASLAERHFAIIIDEAHAGQTGRNAAQVNRTLAGGEGALATDDEDKINELMESRRLLPNASYFAFTATPKNKTEELFGTRYEEDDAVMHRPFHVYTMKQAIEEGFILDVLKNYTTVESWYRIVRTVEDDPMFDTRRAQKKLRAFVEGKRNVIAQKAAVMAEHFCASVARRLGGKARAMIVTSSIERCAAYYRAVNDALAAEGRSYRALIAFSGEHEGVTCAEMNGFPDTDIPARFKEDPYRILVVADMFQTGFDEPLLTAMYVDKKLAGIAAVQTLSRLNRAYPGKREVCVLDFANNEGDVADAFAKYYRTTLLAGETDPNKLHDLIAVMEGYEVYAGSDVERVVRRFLEGAERPLLDPTLDACAARYMELEVGEQIAFKSAAKNFVRTYQFLAMILSSSNAAWEKMSIFLHLLVPKLPSPPEEDLAEGILETVDLGSYRNAAREAIAILCADEDAVLSPVPTGSAAHPTAPELDPLSEIVAAFNKSFGNIVWTEDDEVRRQIYSLPAQVAQDRAYRNAMKNSDAQNARTESDRVLQDIIYKNIEDYLKLILHMQSTPGFEDRLRDFVFDTTYNGGGVPRVPTLPYDPHEPERYAPYAEQSREAADREDRFGKRS